MLGGALGFGVASSVKLPGRNVMEASTQPISERVVASPQLSPTKLYGIEENITEMSLSKLPRR